MEKSLDQAMNLSSNVQTVDTDKIWTTEEVSKEYEEMNKVKEVIKRVEIKEKSVSNELADFLPMIKECYSMCNFLINHNNLRKQYQLESEKINEAMSKKDLYTVFEYYGINKWSELTPELLYTHEYKQSDVDIIEKYLDERGIKYDTNSFIVNKTKKWLE